VVPRSGTLEAAVTRYRFPSFGGDPATEVAIRWGAFLNSIIAFIVIAFVVWQVSRMLIKEDPELPVKTCPFCKEANAEDATKCKACASEI